MEEMSDVDEWSDVLEENEIVVDSEGGEEEQQALDLNLALNTAGGSSPIPLPPKAHHEMCLVDT